MELITPFNIRMDLMRPIATDQGLPTYDFQKFITNLLLVLQGMYTINVNDFGARGDGNTNASQAFNDAITALIQRGGGTIFIPSGTYVLDFPVFVPVGIVPILFRGVGNASIVKRRSNIPAGAGMFDLSGSNVYFNNFKIDGNTLVPVPLQYGANFVGIGGDDPMAQSLTTNTSVWIHGNTSGFQFLGMTFTHTTGYAILADAMNGDVSDIIISGSDFRDNRPNTFGFTPGALDYGAWTGGIYLNGDGRTTTSGVVSNVLVDGCRFSRNSGNTLWMHSYGFDRLNQNIRVIGNSFEDCGLDGVLIGAATGGVVANNTFRRIGYVTYNDIDRATPKWLNNKWAVAIDSSGLVKGVDYVNNSITSPNGGAIDADGHGMSVIGGNICRVPFPDEPEWAEDQIDKCGPTNSGATSYGYNGGNTSNQKYGGQYVNIVGNTFINMRAGSVRLYAGRDCLVEANQIIAPDDSVTAPIAMGPGGAGANQGCTGNYVKHNRASYSPAAPAPLVLEDPTVAPFSGTDVNQVFGNCPIVGNGLAFEFQNDAGSGSPVWLENPWFS